MTPAPALLSVLLLSQTAAPSTVKITEVAYDVVGSEPDGEWIELANTGSQTVPLDELRLGDEESLGGSEAVLAFPAGDALDPGQVIVVAVNAAAFEAAFGFAPDYEVQDSSAAVPTLTPDRSLGGTQLQLANSMDEVLLLDASGLLVDGVSWGRSPALPGIVNTPVAREGQTIARDLDEATGSLRPWTIGAPTAGALRLIPSSSQNPPPDPGPVEPPPDEEPAPPDPDPEAPPPEEPPPTDPGEEPPEPQATPPEGDVETDDGRGVDLDRSDRFDGPILPESSGGCGGGAAPAGALPALLFALGRRRRR